MGNCVTQPTKQQPRGRQAGRRRRASCAETSSDNLLRNFSKQSSKQLLRQQRDQALQDEHMKQLRQSMNQLYKLATRADMATFTKRLPRCVV